MTAYVGFKLDDVAMQGIGLYESGRLVAVLSSDSVERFDIAIGRIGYGNSIACDCTSPTTKR